ncbi:MAG TPA: hypothetical protein VJ931_06580 [Actinomycetota bacterium]|nr:hypothetical protein [Actinomycetota bacterium]
MLRPVGRRPAAAAAAPLLPAALRPALRVVPRIRFLRLSPAL